MNRTRTATRTATLSVAVVGAAALVTSLLTPGAAAAPPDGFQAAKAASAKYHSQVNAERDGFTSENEPCVEVPGVGAMGTHYVHPARIGDPAVDALKPEILLYAPGPDGKDRLVGVEYLVLDADGDLSTDDDRPSLFGRGFDGPMPGHAPGMPAHYDLHVWFWADNPAGTYAPFNPTLDC